MVHTVQNMDGKTSSRIFNFEHLKPLSMYARTIACDAETSLQDPVSLFSPFINFKIEIANSCAQKRKLDELDEGYETPLKQPFSPTTFSPDLGCVMDFYSPTGRRGSVSNFPSLLDEIKSESERGNFVVEVGGEEPVKEMHLDPNGKGYFSVSNKKDFKMEQNISGSPPLPSATSTPLHRTGNAKIKSIVESCSHHTTIREPAALSPSRDRSKHVPPRSDDSSVSRREKHVRSTKNQRPGIFNDELDWETEKRRYVHLVTRHLNENSQGRDVMSELQNLMSSVADQIPGSNTRKWQHPSDLTSRNYQQHFGNATATITLGEWHSKHRKTFKRFDKVSKVFTRSNFS